ncbi:MAG: 1-deoxy-D-xylulose-5-phosphate reductoisomerase, partial [Salinivirgaceae bacterium]|nr:1-deoxy-D-xylulose-5-phosphate reductoisomerase [Salinivirgaceae bacterium]
ANEVAVDAFLKGRIGFLDIAETIEKTMQQMPFISQPTYDDYVATDRESREFARGLI